MSILIVDDAGIMRMILRDILMRFGHFKKEDIFEAVDGEDAIRKYRKHEPEVVLCDIAMPDMDGIEVVKKLKEFDPNVKIIMCTASSDQSDVRECVSAGAKDYIIKPPKPERVMQAIEAVMGQKLGEGIVNLGANLNVTENVKRSTNEGSAVTRQEFDALKTEVERLSAIIESLNAV